MAAAGDETHLERRQRRRVRGSRALAAGLLALAGAVFVATLFLPEPGRGALLLRAVAEAALAGGLADWFAVTALFRRPLGLPIPHTAILPANKERIGEGLARFLDRHFLTSEILLSELRALRPAERLACWLAERRHAAAVAAELGRMLPPLLRALDDRQLRAFLGRALGAQWRNAELAPLFGELLRGLAAAGCHEAVLDHALDYAGDFLARNRDGLLAALAERRRRWIPRAINREIARALLRAAGELIDDLRRPEGTARQALIAQIEAFADDLSAARGTAGLARARRALFSAPQVQTWLAVSWHRLRDRLLADLAAPAAASRTQRALTPMVASLGEALKADAAMRARLDAALEAVVAEALPWRAELIRFVTEVVRRWEPRSFADRIEAAVGADLQYIRMNGTIVGGLVGGLLYALSLLAR